MKKRFAALVLLVALLMAGAPAALANMAAPRAADTGTAVTFQKNQDIAVVEEVLDITVTGSTARIRAEYTMENTTRQRVTTQAMFLCPNQQNPLVTLKGEPVEFTTQTYVLGSDSEVGTRGWTYSVLYPVDQGKETELDQKVDAISFEMTFAPGEQCPVMVEYTYALGGYPDYDFDAKRGEIQYYLQPAAEWKEFGGLTINLYLDKDMPVVTQSNLSFKKVASRTYQYVSDTLPQEELEITIGESWYQKIFSTLRSPYLGMTLLYMSPVIGILLVAVLLVALKIRRNKKKKKEQQEQEQQES